MGINHSGREILVVDDQPSVCNTVKAVLKTDGYAVATAASGQEALALLGEHQFDLVITDFLMPGMTGDQLAAAIKTRTPHQRILMMTASAATLNPNDEKLAGVDLIMNKPFQIRSLLGAVAQLCTDAPRRESLSA